MSQGQQFQKLIKTLRQISVDVDQQPGWLWQRLFERQPQRWQRWEVLSIVRRMGPWPERARDE